MKKSWLAIGIIPLGILAGCDEGKATAEVPADRGPVELTIYNQDFATVREERKVELKDGRTRLQIQHVSKELDPTSVIFNWKNPNEALVVANTYDLGVSGGGDVLSRYVGEDVEMTWRGSDGRTGERIKGRLEAAGEDGTVIRTKEKLIINPTGTIEVPARTDVVTIPQLSVDVEAKGAKNTDLSMTYITEGLSWGADYVGTLAADSEKMNLECWATVTNRTGTSFPNAKISLVAGSPNRAARSQFQAASGSGVYVAKRAISQENYRDYEMKPRSIAPIAAGELYSYPVEAKATIAPDQMNRVRLMSSDSVPVTRDYSITLPYYYDYAGGQPSRQQAVLAIRFYNKKENNLGQPLPGGSVRFYEPDEKGAPVYIGAASISDTPKEGRVDLTLTNVFDVTSESRIVETKRIDRRTVRRKIEVILKNEKKRAVKVRVVYPTYGNPKMATESHKSVRLSASMLQWEVNVLAGAKTKLEFVVDSSD